MFPPSALRTQRFGDGTNLPFMELNSNRLIHRQVVYRLSQRLSISLHLNQLHYILFHYIYRSSFFTPLAHQVPPNLELLLVIFLFIVYTFLVSLSFFLLPVYAQLSSTTIYALTYIGYSARVPQCRGAWFCVLVYSVFICKLRVLII